MEKHGYWGKVLEVNLSTKSVEVVDVPDEYYRQYLGGYGLGVRYVYERIPKDADPLGPDNILGFCPGLFTGTPNPFTGRYMVCGKSPLTGGWGDANSGGFFGPAIKRCGVDAIFVKGIAEKPTILKIIGDKMNSSDCLKANLSEPKITRRVALMGAAASVFPSAWSQVRDAYRIVVPFPAGGGMDSVARCLGKSFG